MNFMSVTKEVSKFNKLISFKFTQFPNIYSILVTKEELNFVKFKEVREVQPLNI